MSKSKNDSYLHILKYTGLFGGIQGLNILVGLIRNKLVAIILGPAGMGLLSLFNSTINLLSNTTNLGVPVSSVKYLSEAKDTTAKKNSLKQVSIIRHWEFITAIIGAVICLVLSPFINRFAFTWGDHTLHFAMLAPIVGMMAITGGETAILKAVGQLRSLAIISVLNVVFALITSIPLYYFYGMSGIVPSLVIIAFVQLFLTLRVTLKLFPLHYQFEKKYVKDGIGMIKMGLAFVAANFFTYGADFMIRRFLNTSASLEELGLYNAAFMLSTVYAGVIFSSLETDYFPRLSSVNKFNTSSNLTVNRQIEVIILLAAPMLTIFMIALPLIVPILFSSSFKPAIGMVQICILSLYIKAIKLPIAYMTLAKGDSVPYLFLEAYSSVLLVVTVVIGYSNFGLVGAGWGFLITELIDIVVILIYTSIRYQYKMTRLAGEYIGIQLPIAIIAFLITLYMKDITYWTCGILISLLSVIISINILRKKTNLWNKLKMKYFSRNVEKK